MASSPTFLRAFPPYLILGIVSSGIFVAALDMTAVVTALPDIMTDLRLPVTELDQVAWIIAGYLLGYTAAMPLMGRVSDVYGHGRIYVVSLLIFMVGSLFVATAPSLGWLVGARVFQAIGGGAVVPVSMAIAGDIFPERRRGPALGMIGAVAEGGVVLGPLYGGVITHYLDWRWIFWINLPIGFLIILLVLVMLRPTPRLRGTVDYWGGLLLTASLTLLAVALSQGPGQPQYFLCLLGAVGLFALFLLREMRTAQPLIDLSMFRSLTLSSANATNLLVGGALIMAMVNIPLMADTIMGRSALEGGLRLMRLTAAIPVGALVGGFLCQRLGYRLPTALGLALSATGFFLMSRWGLDIADPWMTLHLAIGGLGFGVVIAPITTAVLNSVREGLRGVASALVTALRMVGMLIGLSALSAWGMGRFEVMTAGLSLSEILEAPEELTGPVMGLFHDFFLAAMAMCLLAILPALFMRRQRGRPDEDDSD